MSNIGSSYSQIIHPVDYMRLMSNEHLYISDADQFIVQKIKELAPTSTEIVELGCGPGRVLSLVSEIEGINLTGVEPDQQFGDYAKEIIKKPNVQIITASAEQYQHPKKVDIFYSQGVHHHVAKGIPTHNYLKNVFNSLKDNGYYILSDEFLAHYSDPVDRERKDVIWHAHIIADAIKNNFSYLAQEEAKTLLDDLFEGRACQQIKSRDQIHFVLSKVEMIDEAAQKGKGELANQLAQEFLEGLEAYHNLSLQGDVTVDLSRGDYKICEHILKQELEEASFKIEAVRSVGPIETSGALSIYILRKG
jgi:SAM-dependent methyltransferase